MRRPRPAVWALSLLCCVACAGSMDAAVPASTQPLELSLTHADGRRFELSALRGRPVLLFLFATYDDASQFDLVPLSLFAERERHVQVLGLALQPEADTFLRLFQRAMRVPFELYYDSSNQLLHGETALGKIRGIPALVLIDAEGRVRDVHYGIATSEQLQELAGKLPAP